MSIPPTLLQTLTDEELRAAVPGLLKDIQNFEDEVRLLKEKIQHLELESRHDPLTGLKNRRGFEEDVEGKILVRKSMRGSRRKISGLPLTLLFIDVDNFKFVNDTYGHPMGDTVLKEISTKIRKLVRPDDVVARLGGEEIVVCLSDVDEKTASAKAEEIRSTVEHLPPFGPPENEGKFGVTVSIGVASTKETRFNLEKLMSAADRAMYAAKRGGKNRVVLFSSLKESM